MTADVNSPSENESLQWQSEITDAQQLVSIV